MDIFVYDNITTYIKRNPNRDDENMELEVYKTMITKSNSFWFFTHMNKIEENLNINKPYVHWHDGLQSINKMQFDEPPTIISKKQWKYNPKNGYLEANPSRFSYWNGRKYRFFKPKYFKKVTYYSSTGKVPPRKMACTGVWFYDLKFQRINIMLDYIPPAQKVHEMDTKTDFDSLQKRLDKLKSSFSNAV